MLGMLGLLLRWLASLLKSRRQLKAENLVFRHQVNILRRRASGRLRFSNADRVVFIWLYRLCSSVVPTIGFKLLYCLVFLAHRRRELVHHAVTAHPTAEWVALQMTEAFPWDTAPRYLVRDRDGVYGHVVRRSLHALGIRDRPTAPRSPRQSAYVERLIGSVRRECLDHGVPRTYQ